uniref:proline and serine-rich protein 2 n=1 Tax=Monopterus albus TaxID=43700 RepID=UPI0009B2E672|nr:proline and serine-rich protein 2 [Monopterus albus]
MDVHLQANPQHQYAVNGRAGRNSRPVKDDTLRFFREERECLKFFEDTIGSLEEGPDHCRTRQVKAPVSSSGRVEQADSSGTPSLKSGVTVSSLMSRPPKDQDIIDLVHPEPDFVQTKEPVFSPTSSGFQSMFPTRESHSEVKPRHDPMDSLPSEYNPTLPGGTHGSTDYSYHPPGCIPTPVLIAQNIALHRRQSLESEKPPSYSNNIPVKQGPPTSAKPTRFPANINMTVGNKEQQNQSVANTSIQERRSQMLANLTGTSHPLLLDDPQQAIEQKDRNTPTRNISPRDPERDQSRAEALSKLGLTRNQATSGGMSLPSSTSLDPGTTEINMKLAEAKVTTSLWNQSHVDGKPQILRTGSHGSNIDRNSQPNLSPLSTTKSTYSSPPLETKVSTSTSPEVRSLEFNSYGGKSIVVQPSVSSRSEPVTSPTSHDPKVLPPALAKPSEFNNFGGKTKPAPVAMARAPVAMTPAPVAMTRNDLPDILSSHIDKSQSYPAKSEPLPTEPNHYGGKSQNINPSTGLSHPSNSSARSFKAPAPAPAPKPHRHTIQGAHQRAAPQVLSPDHKQKPASMFRPESITVQFSGRGPMTESRKEALRKLGLLKES